MDNLDDCLVANILAYLPFENLSSLRLCNSKFHTRNNNIFKIWTKMVNQEHSFESRHLTNTFIWHPPCFRKLLINRETLQEFVKFFDGTFYDFGDKGPDFGILYLVNFIEIDLDDYVDDEFNVFVSLYYLLCHRLPNLETLIVRCDPIDSLLKLLWSVENPCHVQNIEIQCLLIYSLNPMEK